MDLKDIGARLKQARNSKGYSLRLVGQILQVDHSYIGKIENGKVANPGINILGRLCQLYNIDEAELFGKKADIPPNVDEEALEWIAFAKENEVTPEQMKKYIEIVKQLKDMS